MATALEQRIDNHEQFVATYICACMVTTLVLGVMLLFSADVKLLRFAEFLPYPGSTLLNVGHMTSDARLVAVICAFLGAIGVLMFKIAFHITSENDWNQFSKFIPRHVSYAVTNASDLFHLCLRSLVLGIYVGACQLWKINPFYILPPAIPLCILLFYLVLFVAGISVAEAEAEGWLYSEDHFRYRTHRVQICWLRSLS
jgi:hypothetical protein